jgi:tetratricopeptide (TPR) repeat protein
MVNLATCYRGLGRERDAVAEYEKAFKIQPALLTGSFVNHEYGFTLVRLGELDKAEGAFRKMVEQKDPALQARGRRSLALLEMYRGRYAAAAAQFREAILLSKASGHSLSEFRDRLFLARVLEARGSSAAARREVAIADTLASATTFAPGWLHLLGKAHARGGRIREADRVLARLPAAAGDPTAASPIDRSNRADNASAYLLRGEVALARGRASEALGEFELAHRMRPNSESLEARAVAHLKLKRYADAEAALAELIERRELGRETQHEWFMAHSSWRNCSRSRADPPRRQNYTNLFDRSGLVRSRTCRRSGRSARGSPVYDEPQAAWLMAARQRFTQAWTYRPAAVACSSISFSLGTPTDAWNWTIRQVSDSRSHTAVTRNGMILPSARWKVGRSVTHPTLSCW